MTNNNPSFNSVPKPRESEDQHTQEYHEKKKHFQKENRPATSH